MKKSNLKPDKKDTSKEITPLVKSLSGIISLPNDFSFRKEYSKFLAEKYQ